ncbi:Ribosomal protein L24 [Dillenia turbinata]|uniref:Ribosomal protein L24 n=1 Tax=Dillenia turbinata TaxID=194707 RepID=A0AAN8ZVL4_9MAGN
MAAMAACQCSMSALSLSSSSFFGQRLFPPASLSSPQIKSTEKPCMVVMRLKRWERKKCKPNSLPILQKMHVKIGDTVKVISGHEKGKIGEIIRIFKHNSTVILKDLNLKTKHVKKKGARARARADNQGPIHSSNVMLYWKEQNVASRVGHKFLEDGTRVRYLLKTGEIIDSAENRKRMIKERSKKTEEAVAAS